MAVVRGANDAEIVVDVVAGGQLGLVRVGFHQFTQTIHLTAERLRELARACERTAAQLDAATEGEGDGRREP